MVEYPSRAAIISALITPALNYITHSELCPAPTPQQSFMLTVSKFELSNRSISVAQTQSQSVICTCALVVGIIQWLFLPVGGNKRLNEWVIESLTQPFHSETLNNSEMVHRFCVQLGDMQ